MTYCIGKANKSLWSYERCHLGLCVGVLECLELIKALSYMALIPLINGNLIAMFLSIK